jgi:hypothetical protein
MIVGLRHNLEHTFQFREFGNTKYSTQKKKKRYGQKSKHQGGGKPLNTRKEKSHSKTLVTITSLLLINNPILSIVNSASNWQKKFIVLVYAMIFAHLNVTLMLFFIHIYYTHFIIIDITCF